MLNQENTNDMNEFESRVDLSEIKQKIDQLKHHLAQVIIGQEAFIDQLIIALLGNGHVLIEGVPGVAKTLAAKSLAKSIATQFTRIQFTPDLMPSDVLGTTIYNQKSQEFELRKGHIYSNIVLIDEINRAPAKTQAALFEVMEEYQITVDGTSIPLEAPFMVLATQNPIEHEGTYRLPEAQLDRFMMKILVSYPSQQEEIQVLSMHHHANAQDPTKALVEVLNAKEILALRNLVKQVSVSESILSYINDIVRLSRNFNGIYMGASPRGGVAILNAAKAKAAMEGRDFVIPDDIKYCALPVLRHRILLSPEKEMEGVQADDLLNSLLNQVEVPR